MRVLQLRDGGAEPLRLDLHRQLSVVRGLRPAERIRVAEALRGVPNGRFTGVGGVIEAHGIRFAFDEASLALLGLADDLDVVIGPEDLPGHDRTVSDAAERRAEAEEERRQAKRQVGRARAALSKLEQRQRAITTDLDRLRSDDDDAELARADLARRMQLARDELKQHHEQLDAATSAVDEAKREEQRAADARATALGTVEEARETGRRAVERRAGVLTNIEGARTGIDPEALGLHERAQARLAELEAALEEPEPDLDPEAAAAAAEQDRRRARRNEISRLLLALPETSPSAVVDTVATAKAYDDVEPVEVPEAVELADRWRDFHAQGEVEEAPDPSEIEAARTRLEEAKADLAGREGGSAQRFDADDVRALETAHAEVLDNQQRAEGRFGGDRAQRRLAAARDAERTILDRLGFTTYADFMMSSPTAPGAGDEDPELEAARMAVGAARVELRALLERTDPAAEARRAARAELADATVELLGAGVGPDSEQPLRDLRRPPDEAPVVARLRAALTAAGLAVHEGDGLDRAALVILGEAWIEEQRAAAEQRQALLTELEDLGEGENEAPGPEQGVDVAAAMESRRRQAELDEARAAVEATAARADAHRQAIAHVEELEATLAASEEDERAAADSLAEREGEVTGHERAVAEAAELVQRAEQERVQALAAVDQATAALTALDDETGRAPADEVAQRVATLTDELGQLVTRTKAAETELRLLEVRLTSAEERLAAEQEAEKLAVDSRPQSDAEIDALVDEIEWFLLTRLAAQRSVGVVGSVPLVLDDPFGELTTDGTRRLVEHLTRMAPTVQVVLMTDDGELAAWAEAAGEDRAGLVHALRPGA